MKNEMKFRIGPGGVIDTIYQDGLEEFAKDIGADLTTVCRASNVEWEEERVGPWVRKGWSVRAAHDNELALRENGILGVPEPSRDRERPVHFFGTREEALKLEVQFFWQLLPPKEDRNVREEPNH